MSDRWGRLVEAVGHAATLNAEAAHAYLRGTFHDDPQLLAEAREILTGGLEQDTFLAPTAREVSTPATGTEIGPFRLVRLLGQGGMGTVFVAEQEHPQRTVALKILNSVMLSPKAHARFEYEVQALASLRHRGIAQVYEAGVHHVDDGLIARDVPWFAMEYVENASTILEHARALPVRRRLELFVEVLEAVQHGHQKGVVHRDLKPDNILVDGEGRPKVIDFGVAKSTAPDAPLTTIGSGVPQIVGTLPYLAPERVTTGRDVADVRSDVYALGVILYQLLADRLPIEVDPADIVTSARRICEELPPRPSSANAKLPADLDAVVLKALAKDPEQRYPSVGALGADIRRFLGDLPVLARPPKLSYQLRLFARRHRTFVISAAAVVAIGATATAVSVNWAMQSEQSEQKATKERAEAVAQRSRAEQLFETVFKRSFDATLREAPKLHKMAGNTERVKAMMDAVLEDLRLLESMAEGDPRVQVLIAETWGRLGDTQGNKAFANLGDSESAQVSYRHALEICETVLQQHPTHRGARLASVRTLVRLGDILDQAERVLRMRRKEDPALRKERRAFLERALVEAQALYRDDPAFRVSADELVDAHVRLGRLAGDEQAFEVMRVHAKAVMDLYDAGHISHPLNGQLLLAWSYHAEENWEASRVAWAAVVATAADQAQGPNASNEARHAYASHLGAHGESAFLSGHRVEATQSLEHAIRIFETLAEEAPKDRRVGIQLYIHLTELARVYGALADEDEAQRTSWLMKSHAVLSDALRGLGPEEDDNRHRAGMRRMLQADLDKLDEALGR